MSEQQFETFWAYLQESDADYEDHLEELKAAFLKATKNQKKSIPTKNAGKSHKKSGYNLFMSHSMKVDKMAMPEAVAAWKTLSDTDKEKWNAKAKEEVAESKENDLKVRKTHKKSGYNIYMSHCMKSEKMKMQDVPSWKTLPENEKKKWNTKAAEINKA